MRKLRSREEIQRQRRRSFTSRIDCWMHGSVKSNPELDVEYLNLTTLVVASDVEAFNTQTELTSFTGV